MTHRSALSGSAGRFGSRVHWCTLAAVLMLANVSWVANASADDQRAGSRVALGIEQDQAGAFRIPLYTMKPDGSDLRQLTDPAWGSVDTAPAWTPDGKKLVFEHRAGGIGNIETINADGTGLRILTRCHDSSCGNGSPVWAHDGQTIVFEHCCVAANGGQFDGLSTMRADGSHVRQLTLNPDPNWGDNVPTVSPDGRWVAFSRGKGVPSDPTNLSVTAMYVVGLDGSGLRQVTSYDLMVDEKSWSPEGNRIVFTSHAGSNSGPFRADIFTVDADGSHLRQLTHTTPGTDLAFFPSWSPSGNRIMFEYAPSGACDNVYTMRPDGSDRQQVTSTDACKIWPVWGPVPD